MLRCADWYSGLHWEDVLVGILVRDYVGAPQPSAGATLTLEGPESGLMCHNLRPVVGSNDYSSQLSLKQEASCTCESISFPHDVRGTA